MRLFISLALAALAAALAPPAGAQTRPAPIETERLAELNAWTVGALTRGDGAFAPDLWANSDSAFVASLLGRLPAVYESPAAQALARRVLLSGGEAPSGDAANAARQRFEALGKMGAADELAIMATGAGASLADPAIAQYAAQAELSRGRRPEACARGRAANSGGTPAPFILRLRAYCAAIDGDRGAADLALDLARAAGADDVWYTGAVAAAGGAPSARPPIARYDNSLSAALSLAAQLRPGPNPLGNASTLSLLLLARAENAPQPQRAQAAVLAYRRGSLNSAQARAILRATPATITTAAPPLLVTLRQVEAAPGSLQAGAAVAAHLRQANAPADFVAIARFFKDDIAAFQAAPDQASATVFARAAVAAGDVALAQRLMASARQAGVAEASLAPLEAALAALSGPNSEAMRRRIDAGGASLARAAARDVAILSALGAPADGAVLSFMAANPPQGGAPADAAALLALAAAVERRATGEAALLAVLAAGEGGPARLDASSLDRILRALRALGLEQDARRFGAEALLAGVG